MSDLQDLGKKPYIGVMAVTFPNISDVVAVVTHEKLDGLMGGDNDEHYHLTLEEYDLLSEVLDKQREENESEEMHYKLAESEYDKITTLLEMFFPDDDTDAETALQALIAKYIKTIDSGGV